MFMRISKETLKAAGLIGLGLLALLIYAAAKDYFTVDKCFDSGGVWDDNLQICKH